MSVYFTPEEVFVLVLETLRAQVGGETQLTLDTALLYDLGMDSLEIVELGVALEKKLGVPITRTQIRRCETLADVVDLIVTLADKSALGATV